MDLSIDDQTAYVIWPIYSIPVFPYFVTLNYGRNSTLALHISKSTYHIYFIFLGNWLFKLWALILFKNKVSLHRHFKVAKCNVRWIKAVVMPRVIGTSNIKNPKTCIWVKQIFVPNQFIATPGRIFFPQKIMTLRSTTWQALRRGTMVNWRPFLILQACFMTFKMLQFC